MGQKVSLTGLDSRTAAANDGGSQRNLFEANGPDQQTALVVSAPTENVADAKYCTLPIPSPGPTQVRIKLVSAGLNPVDVKRMNLIGGRSSSALTASQQAVVSSGSGKAAAQQAIAAEEGRHQLPRFAFPYVVGCDGSGIIDAVGSDVVGGEGEQDGPLRVGDRVCVHLDITKPHGTLAQFTIAEAATVCRIPDSVSFDDAAAIPCASWTAYLALFDKLRIEVGQTVFVAGAAGGVGSCAVQLAKSFGCRVIASCSAHNVEMVSSTFGADLVLDYNAVNIVESLMQFTNGFGVDAIVDAVSPASGIAYAAGLRFGGALCQVAGVYDGPMPSYIFTRQLSVHHLFLGGLHGSPLTRPLLRTIGDQVLRLFEEKKFCVVKEVIERERVGEALALLQSGHSRGKIVVRLEPKKKKQTVTGSDRQSESTPSS